MHIRTEGIVLKNQPVGEADLIVTYLTSDRGIITTFAKSPRKIRSRFGSSLEPFTFAHIALLGKEQSMPKITRSDIIHTYESIRNNLEDFLAASSLAETLINLVPAGHGGKNLFGFFKKQLDTIESHQIRREKTVNIVSLIHLLAILGYSPGLTGRCGRCEQETKLFFPAQGTMLCVRCAPKGEKFLSISKGTINFYKHINTWTISNITKLKPSRTMIKELSALLNHHIEYITNKRLKTTEFTSVI